MANSRTAGRAPVSMRADQYAWLDQLLEVASRGGDLRVMMRSPIAGRVKRIVAGGKARALKEPREQRGVLKYQVVLAAAREAGCDLNKDELAKLTGYTRDEAGNALHKLSALGLMEHIGAKGINSRWRVVGSVTQLSERKVAVR